MVEFLAVGSFCLTFIFGAAVIFLLIRLHMIRRELTRRLEQVEAQLAARQPRAPKATATPSPFTGVRPTAPGPEPPPVSLGQTGSQTIEEQIVAAASVAEPASPTSAAAPREAITPAKTPPPTPPPHKPFTLPAPIMWFLERHLLVQIGALILFIGVGFLLKYAADQGWLSLEMRHIGAAAGGIALAAVGWRLRREARTYALALQGAGLGVIYLTTFFAFRIYGLIPGSLAFALFVALGALCAGLAIINDARIMAFLAVVGAFLAPILASSGPGSHVALFSYYLVVNAAIVAIAWFKAWRSLNLAGFALTLAGGLAWGVSAYEPAFFATTEPFLVIFFLFYLTIAILFARRQASPAAGQRPDPVDVTLVFGNPLVAFSLQLALVAPYKHGAAISALALGLLYLGLAGLMLRRVIRVPGVLVESFLFLSFLFLALSAPLFFDPQVTAAMWAISGAAWVWLGVRRQRIWNVAWGVLVQFGAGLAHLIAFEELLGEPIHFFSLVYLGAYIVGLAGLYSAYWLRPAPDAAMRRVRATAASVLSLWGLGWWFGGGTVHSGANIGEPYIISSLVVFYALSAMAGELAGVRLNWRLLRLPLAFLLPIYFVLSVLQLFEAPHHFAGGGWYAWPLALAAHYWMLWRNERDAIMPALWRRFCHAGALWLIAFLLSWDVGWAVDHWFGVETWVTVAVSLVLTGLIWLAAEWVERLPAFLARYAQTYRILGAGPLALFVLLWISLIRAEDGGSALALPFMPLLNPLDLSAILTFGVLMRWLRRLPVANRTWVYVTWGTVAFFALNQALARTVHHLTGVDFAWESLFFSPILQTTYAIVWSVLALALMFWATRRHIRAAWLGGAAVLALTILKLFFVDLVNANTLARIISFIGVGLLVIVIAYFAPAPSAEKKAAEPADVSTA